MARQNAKQVLLTRSQLMLIDAAVQAQFERATGDGTYVVDVALAPSITRALARLVEVFVCCVHEAFGLGVQEDISSGDLKRLLDDHPRRLSLDELIAARRELVEAMRTVERARGPWKPDR